MIFEEIVCWLCDYLMDSSALVKRYVIETGTAWVRSLTHYRTGNQIFLARITIVEVTSAIARRRAGRTIRSAQASSFLSRFREHVAKRYTVLEVRPALLADATTLANRHALRAYVAVQLAVALEQNRISQGGFAPPHEPPHCTLFGTLTRVILAISMMGSCSQAGGWG
jgi:predicted nucleic acid-binding protein